MSFMDWPMETEGDDWRSHARRRRNALRLIEAFAGAFPTIAYTLVWSPGSSTHRHDGSARLAMFISTGGLFDIPGLLVPLHSDF